MKLLKLYKKAGIIVFLLLELILFSAITPNFLSGSNFINLLRQIAMLGIASIGISFLMIGGASADLSIAGQIPVLSMLCGIFMMWMNLPVPVAMLLTIAAGILLGYFNGMVIRILKINPFVVTLSTMTILQGVALLFTGGVSISGLPRSFSWLGQGYLFGIPAPIIVLVVCVAGAQFVLSKTYFGRDLCNGRQCRGRPACRHQYSPAATVHLYAVRLFCGCSRADDFLPDDDRLPHGGQYLCV